MFQRLSLVLSVPISPIIIIIIVIIVITIDMFNVA